MRPVGAVGVGLLLGGLATALLVSLVGSFLLWIPVELRALAVAGVAGVGLLHQAFQPWRLPQRSKLIPVERLSLPSPFGPLLFGGELGLGFRTVVPATLPYVLVVCLLLSASIAAAAAAATGWALGRFIPIAWGARNWERAGGLYPLLRGQRWLSAAGLVIALAASVAVAVWGTG